MTLAIFPTFDPNRQDPLTVISRMHMTALAPCRQKSDRACAPELDLDLA